MLLQVSVTLVAQHEAIAPSRARRSYDPRLPRLTAPEKTVAED